MRFQRIKQLTSLPNWSGLHWILQRLKRISWPATMRLSPIGWFAIRNLPASSKKPWIRWSLFPRRLSFDYLVVPSHAGGLPDQEIARLETKIGSLSEQMFHEIAVDANLFIEQSLIGKDQVTRNALRPIKRMRDKLDGLGFLDYRVAPVVTTIDSLLSRIPDTGAIEGGLLQEILATAMLLADPDKTRRHGEGLLIGSSNVMATDDDLSDLNAPQIPAETVELESGIKNPQSAYGNGWVYRFVRWHF